MSKLKEVKMPPLDGTEFVVVYVVSGFLLTDKVMIINGNPIAETPNGWVDYEETPLWDSDLDARYFVIEK